MRVLALLALLLPADLPDELLLSPKQDGATLKRAWSTLIDVKYKSINARDFLKDLAKQTGLDIRVSKAVEPLEWVGAYPGKQSAALNLYERARFRHFAPELAEAAPRQPTWTVKCVPGSLDLKSDDRLPAAYVLEYWMAREMGRMVSYRKDHILVSTVRELLPELVVTRTYRFKNAWGSTHQVQVNGKLRSYRLTVEDTVARVVLSQPYDYQDTEWGAAVSDSSPDPTGSAARLRSLKRASQVTFDAATQTLTVTAMPVTVWLLEMNTIKKLGEPAPEVASAGGRAFVQERLRTLADEAWEEVGDEAREALKRSAGEFTKNPADVAVREKLEAAGVAAASPLLAADLKTLPEQAHRAVRSLLDAIYGAHEIAAVQTRAESYLKAGRTGDLAELRKTFWGAAREKAFAEEKKDFDKKKGSYEEWLARSLKIEDPRIETIRILGPRAEVSFSAKVPLGHPLADAVRELRKEGIDRPVSKFGMELEAGVWKAVPASASIQSGEGTLVWAQTDAPASSGVKTSREFKKFRDGESAGVSGSAFSYAITFGY
jgi:hypothetical protein